MLKERDDHGFHVGIFEQADAASTHVKIARPGIHAESEVRIVPAADYGMEMISSARPIHGISQRLGLVVGNQFIVGPVNNEHRRFVLMDIENRTRATREIQIARGFLSKEGRNMCQAQSCQIAHTKQINGTDYIASVAEIFAYIENLRPGCGSEHRRQVTASRFANDRDAVWIVAVLMRARFQPPNRSLAILNLRRPQRGGRQTIIDRGHGVAFPKPLEIVRVYAVARLVAMLPASSMNVDHQWSAITVRRKVEIDLLLQSATCHIREVGNPGNAMRDSWVRRSGV